MIIGFCGKAHSGKDTAAAALVNDGFTKVAFGDALKRLVLETFPAFCPDDLWGASSRRETPYPCYGGLTPRKALQLCGTDFARKCWPNIWVEKTMYVVASLENGRCTYDPRSGLSPTFDARSSRDVVISDVRFANEIAAIHDYGGFVVRIQRLEREVVSNVPVHESESGINDIPISKFDSMITGDGTVAELHDMVRFLLEQFVANLGYRWQLTSKSYRNW
jgi:hypothetical protein